MTEITCSAGCKRTGVLDENGSPPAGWDRLQITGRYRCPTCGRELTAANHIAGTPATFTPDPGANTSRCASTCETSAAS